MNKKSDKKILFIFSFIGILLIGFLIYKVYNDFFNKSEVKKQLDSIGYYGYTLDSNDTPLYKTYFKELSSVLNEKEINFEEYAKSISKLFIVDVFTLNNKLGSTDIGGLDFIHKDLKDNFKENMGYNMYKNIEINLDGERTQKLPIVKSVTIDDVFNTKYTYNDNSYDAYIVSASISYEEDMGYQNSIKLTIINDNKILYIVKGE